MAIDHAAFTSELLYLSQLIAALNKQFYFSPLSENNNHASNTQKSREKKQTNKSELKMREKNYFRFAVKIN